MPQATPLPNTLGDTVQRCQSLLAGTTNSVGLYNRPYLLPFIQQAYSAIAKQIKNGSGKNLEAIIEVLNVPTGTSSLYQWQSYGWVDPNVQPAPAGKRGPLAGLFDPLRLWVKTAGQLPQYYTLARGPRETLPHVNPPGITPGTYAVQVTFSWIGNKLLITPVAGPIDIQVYGRFNPPRLVDDNDELVLYPDMTDTLAFCASALTGVERSNVTILQGYAEQGQNGVDNIVADIVRQSQGNPRRVARMGGCGGSSWGWGGSGVY
jgi:hypothetical protein